MTSQGVFRSGSAPLWLWLPAVLALAGSAAGWLAIGALPDEAYYWVWSQRLQAGYYDHPPLIAWLIWPFATVFDSAVWAIRMPAVLSWAVGAVVGYRLTARVFSSRRAGALAVLVWSTLPAVQIGFHIVTPDAALIIFTWFTYALVQRALTRRSAGWWLVAGFCGGLTVLGKYTGALVPIGILLALLLSREGRRMLGRGGPWLAAASSLVAFAPVVLWNWRNDWISFAFQFGHGVKSAPAGDPWLLLAAFVAGQLAVAMPWTWLAMAWTALRAKAVPATQPATVRHLLQVGFWLPLLVFGAAGMTTEGHPNWPITAYVPGTVLLAGALERWLWPRHRLDERLRAGAALLLVLLALVPVALVNLLRFPDWVAKSGVELPPQRTQLSQSYGWDRVGEALERQLAGDPACIVLGDRLQTASMLGLLLNDARRVGVPMTTRTNQFHLWQQFAAPENACLYVEQFDQREEVTDSASLGALGQWPRARLLRVDNPDLTSRWFGFYVPPKKAPDPS